MRTFLPKFWAHTLRLIAGLTAMFIPSIAWAVTNPTSLDDICDTPFRLPCYTGGSVGFATFMQQYAIEGARLIFLTFGILFFFYYAVRLIVDSDNESTIDETKNAYAYGIGGAAIVSIASYIVDAVGFNARDTIIEEAAVNQGLGNIIFFMKIMVSAAVSVMIAFQGVRLILLQGQESEIEEQKKRFFHGLLGVAIVLLSDAAVDAFLPGNDGALELAAQIAGIINFVLTLIGALTIFAFMAAGFMLVISTDESLKERAKKTIFATIITLIVVMSSYLIVRFVILL